MTTKQSQPVKQPIKRTHAYGKHPYKPTISKILVCACGNKYIKTRPNQDVCVRCLVVEVSAR